MNKYIRIGLVFVISALSVTIPYLAGHWFYVIEPMAADHIVVIMGMGMIAVLSIRSIQNMHTRKKNTTSQT